MELVQLVYNSRPSTDLNGSARLAAFRAIHQTAVEKNKLNAIGGFLVLTKTHFVQLLEGDRKSVMSTYERIRRDPRHTHCTLIDISPCQTRVFEAWAMGTIHDELRVLEAKLSIGVHADKSLDELSAKQITQILARLAKESKAVAA